MGEKGTARAATVEQNGGEAVGAPRGSTSGAGALAAGEGAGEAVEAAAPLLATLVRNASIFRSAGSPSGHFREQMKSMYFPTDGT